MTLLKLRKKKISPKVSPFWSYHPQDLSLRDCRLQNQGQAATIPQFLVDLHPMGRKKTPVQKSSSLPFSKKRKKGPTSFKFLSSLSYGTKNWAQERLTFSMNKFSIIGLIIGLMALGALFFSAGFLIAFTVLPSPSPGDAPPKEAWASANTPGQRVEQGVMQLIRNQGSHLDPFIPRRQMQKIVQAAPPSLQPFAQEAASRLDQQARQRIHQESQQMQGLFQRRPPRQGAYPVNRYGPPPIQDNRYNESRYSAYAPYR